MRRILSIDGGGIKGVFPAALLAAIEDNQRIRIADYFDLIVGTSTGGIIALGLGLGFTASEMLRFYETHGPSIFPKRIFPFLQRMLGARYPSNALRDALTSAFGDRRLGDSTKRLVIPTSNLETGEVLLRKTAHHDRFAFDYKMSVVDVAMGTCAAPTYFKPHFGAAGPVLVDGGLWANNPMAVGVVEGVGVLGWPREEIQVLSLGCTTSPIAAMNVKGPINYATRLVDLFMSTQSSAAVGAASIMVGHDNILRCSTSVDRKRFDLDDCRGIHELRGLGEEQARHSLPEIQRRFLQQPAEAFSPCKKLDE